jgi:DNA-binding transcriptional regulator PaaX
MARIFNQQTLKILKTVSQQPGIPASQLFEPFSRSIDYKSFYNTLYRLMQQKLLDRKDTNQGMCLWINEDGIKLINRFHPEKDGVWKLVIFDIPEKQKYVRVVLRAKLKALHFKKWQNSIWVSPYKLDDEIEAELSELAKKFFVRLIKTKEINHTDDLEEMFV